MQRLRNWWHRQAGQSLAILAIGMVAILGTVGLVVDIGNAYTVQRKVRNAVDASALAAAREMARQQLTTNSQVLGAARRYAELNQVSPDDIQVWYCDLNGTRLQPVNDDGFSPPTEVNDVPVSGVVVEGRKTVSAYLAHLVGVHSFSASQQSMGYVVCGACSAGGGSDGLFPAAISRSSFVNGIPAYDTEYRFWGDKTGAGNFGWLSWDDGSGHTSEPTLVSNLQDLTRSGRWSVGASIPAGPGVKNSSGVKSALNAWIGIEVTVPVYDYTTGSGSNLTYHIVGFVRIKITGYNFQGSDKYIKGEAVLYVEPTGEAGCANLGVCVVKLRPPLTEVRSIAGVVSVWEPRLSESVHPSTEHIPVDVVNVLDTSGSMNDRWGSGGEVKMATAKRVLTIFNNYLLPAEGDKAGLVTFPLEQNGSRYNLLCNSGTYRTRYLARLRSALTDNVTAVNSIISSLTATGGTPLAGAMQMGRDTVLPSGAVTPGRVPVLVVASDGVANCTIDGKWTGQEGYNLGGCNTIAEQQAIEQANMAKQQGIIIFTIAIGDDFNSNLLRAMATEDTDPNKPHFFQAVTQDDLEQIYETIANRVNDIGSECGVEEFEATGDNTVVTIYKDGSTTAYRQTVASSTGAFVFTNVEPGEYTFSATMSRNGLTFDILTEVIGGPEAEEPIALSVGEGKGTYVQDLYLRTSTPLQCE
ncbi:MAG: vWA domain-containing protein [Anaerolineae bacterium]